MMGKGNLGDQQVLAKPKLLRWLDRMKLTLLATSKWLRPSTCSKIELHRLSWGFPRFIIDSSITTTTLKDSTQQSRQKKGSSWLRVNKNWTWLALARNLYKLLKLTILLIRIRSTTGLQRCSWTRISSKRQNLQPSRNRKIQLWRPAERVLSKRKLSRSVTLIRSSSETALMSTKPQLRSNKSKHWSTSLCFPNRPCSAVSLTCSGTHRLSWRQIKMKSWFWIKHQATNMRMISTLEPLNSNWTISEQTAAYAPRINSNDVNTQASNVS